MRFWKTIALPVAAATLVACGDASGPGGGAGQLTLRFTMVPGSATMQAAGGPSLAVTSLPLQGTNGTLTLDEVWLVVRDVRMEPTAASCAESDSTEADGMSQSQVSLHHGFPSWGEGDTRRSRGECAAVTGAPFFVSVPLEGDSPAEIAVDVVPGTYHEIELRTAPPNDSATADLLGQIQNEFPDWPDNASMLVVGSFTPTDGEAMPFRVYFDARIKVEQEFDQDPLVVEDGGNLSVTVTVDPMTWFTNRDGTVDDLSEHDYDTTGEVVPFWANAGEGCRIRKGE